jgi:hypothetical protein
VTTIRPGHLRERSDVLGPEASGQVKGMNIDKDVVLDFLRQHGKEDKVPQAERELPDQVDPERDSGLLSRFGIDVDQLLAMLPDSLRNKIPDGITDKLNGFLK